MTEAIVVYLRRWAGWSRASTNRRILAAAFAVAGATFVVQLAFVCRDLVVAYEFGTGDAVDAFLVAYLLPTFTVTVVAGSYNEAFVPTYVRVRERQGSEAAERLFGTIMIASLVLLLVLGAILAVGIGLILRVVSSGFAPGKLALTRQLFLLLLPSLILGGIATIWTAVLNAHERFSVGAMAPALVHLCAVAVLLLYGRSWGIFALPVGIVLGAILQCALLAAALRRNTIAVWPRWSGVTPEFRQVVRQYLPRVMGAFLISATLVIDQSMAAWLAPGSVAALTYGNKIVASVLGIGSTALGAAVLPHFSRMIAHEEWGSVRHTLRTYGRLIVVVAVPATVALAVLARPIVRAVFERGAFTSADTELVARIATCYMLQMPFYLLAVLFQRLVSSMRETTVIMRAAVLFLTLDIALNLTLIRVLGLAGIALSTSLIMLMMSAYLGRHLARSLAAAGGLPARNSATSE
jgi:putative peptidoglycan lipid II flippase